MTHICFVLIQIIPYRIIRLLLSQENLSGKFMYVLFPIVHKMEKTVASIAKLPLQRNHPFAAY
jgi:hypothetical protein